MARVLVTGMSGTGKSSALAALAQRGYPVVDTDLPEWSVLVPGVGDARDELLWREDRIAELLATGDETLFVSGCAPNQGRFYDRFDAVVLLSAAAEVILERVATAPRTLTARAAASGTGSWRTWPPSSPGCARHARTSWMQAVR